MFLTKTCVTINGFWKGQRKGVQKKKLIDALCENNINTVAEELVSSEHTATTFCSDTDNIIVVDDG